MRLSTDGWVAEKMVNMRYVLSIAAIIIVVWASSIILGAQVSYSSFDSELEIRIPVEGSTIARFTEGGAISHYGRYGLNPVVLRQWDDRMPRFMLLGDSYIEAFQVPDAKKPDAVLSRYLNGKALVLGTGVSGYGFPSMIARASAYEKAIGAPVANIFFCASGIENDILEDSGAVKTKPCGFAASKVPVRSETKMFFVKIVNKFYLNFIGSGMERIRKAFPSLEETRPSDRSAEMLRDEMDYALNAMKHLKGDPIIVYCPDLPRLKNGVIEANNIEQENAHCLQELAKEKDIFFIDVTDALLRCFDEHNCIPRGFPNLGGPGNGHLTVTGIDAVFKYVAEKLKERYDL